MGGFLVLAVRNFSGVKKGTAYQTMADFRDGTDIG